MTRETTTTLPLPAEGTRCTDVLSETLRSVDGIKQVEYDLEQGQLKAVYDPELLSSESAMQVIRQAGQTAARRVARCAVRAAQGDQACGACAVELNGRLAAQYRTAAALPAASIHNGVIVASLDTTRLDRGENIEIETVPTGREAELPTRAPLLTRGKVEILLTAITLVTTLAGYLGLRTGLQPLITGILFATAYIAGGWFGLQAGINALRYRSLNVDLLMILAAVGAAVIGQPAEGAVLLFLFSLSNTLQTYAMDRSRKAIEKLLDLRPTVATVRRGSRLVTIPIEQLALGDTVLVRPGERFPIDGLVLSGESDVDQATITGESIPVHKGSGESVFAGTVNGHGSLEIRTTRLAKDTTLARIVQMVEQAQASKANTQRKLDDFEQGYALFVLAAAALLVAVPVAILGQDFYPAFYRSMTWLVVASPCALVISTPASILSAIANGARSGVLFKGGLHLEKTAGLKALAFDKTGTLTSGTPSLTGLHPQPGTSEEELLRLSAALESRSEHPLAQAILQAAQTRSLDLPPVSGFKALPGQGIEGTVEGHTILIGNERLFRERGISLPDGLRTQVHRLESDGQTVMIVKNGEKWLGLLAVADTLRPDAVEMVRRLKEIGVEHVVMLTGDNPRVAAGIAQRAGVDEFHANLLPQDKVALLKQIQEKYGPVAMVGDGVNDAPALATADIGIAMGGAGSDVALETADVVLMSDDLRRIPFAIGLARRAQKVVWQNLAFSLAVIGLLVAGAFIADLALPLGVLGHEGSTVIVVLNGLRLLGYKPVI